MIWIDKSSLYIEIPRHSAALGTRYKIKFINVLTKQEYVLEVGESESDSALLYRFRIDNLTLGDEGEYEYYLSMLEDVEGEQVAMLIESGLMAYGNYVRENTHTFEPQENTIVQFNG